MKYDHRHHLFTAFCIGAALLFAIPAIWAREAGKLAKVTILATGGTIAGTGATSTTTVGYTAATSAAIRVSSQTTSVGRSFQPGRQVGSVLRWARIVGFATIVGCRKANETEIVAMLYLPEVIPCRDGNAAHHARRCPWNCPG
jgi:hypothetical protein